MRDGSLAGRAALTRLRELVGRFRGGLVAVAAGVLLFGTLTPTSAVPGIPFATQTIVEVHDAAHQVTTTFELGTRIHVKFAVIVPGSPAVPIGQAWVRYFATANCAGGALEGLLLQIFDGGLHEPAASVEAEEVGAMSVQVEYIGNSFYAASQSCTRIDVTKATPTIDVKFHPNGVHDSQMNPNDLTAGGLAVHPSVTVGLTNNLDFLPSGTVTVFRFGNGTCSSGALPQVVVPLTNGKADTGAPSMSSAVPAMLSLRIRYNGDGTYGRVESACIRLRFRALPTFSIVIHDSTHDVVTSIRAGTKIHARVQVGGQFGVPTGTVELRIVQNPNCFGGGDPDARRQLSGGVAHFTDLTPAPSPTDSYGFKAFYLGDDTYKTLGSCATLTVSPAPATPKPTAKPTAKPTVAPTSAPATAAPSVAATTAPGPTGSPGTSDDPGASLDPSPSAGVSPTASAGASQPPTASGEPGPSPVPTARPADASSGQSGMPIFLLLLLLLLLALAIGAYVARRRRRGSAAGPGASG